MKFDQVAVMSSFRKWSLYGLAGLSVSLSIGYRLLAFWKIPGIAQALGVLLLTSVSLPIIHLLFSRTIAPRLAHFLPRSRINMTIAALLIGAFLTVVLPLSEPPWQTLELVETGERILHRNSLASLLGFIFFVADALSFGLVILPVLAWLLTRESSQSPKFAAQRWDWLFYAFPCMAAWSIYLIAFYPALMSPDSIDQWGQAIGKLPLWDPHPLFYTFLLRLLSWVWQSPTAAAVFQILLMALVLGYGLAVLGRAGVSRRILATLSVLASLAPFNGTMAVTIWRDIPYSIAILALTIMLAQLAFQPQKVTQPWFWSLFGVICGILALLRYNGLVVAPCILIPLGLLILFKGNTLGLTDGTGFCDRIFPALAGIVFLVTFSAFQFYFYDFLHIVRHKWSTTVPYVHLIGAHVAAGTPLEPAQSNLLNALSPLSERWHYYEMSSALMLSEGKFNYDVLEENADQMLPIAVALTLRNPGVTIRHLYWSSKLVWQIRQPSKGWLGVTTLQDQPIISNSLGIVPNSPLPGLTSTLSRWIRDSLQPRMIIVWRPAIYLYLSILSVVVGWLRSKNPAWLLVALPATINSVIMLFASINQEIRYMYPMQLASFILVGLMFLPRVNAQPRNNTNVFLE